MPPSLKQEIQITILDDRHGECEVGCGIDWSLPESAELANQQINERFGEAIKLEYINLAANTSATIGHSDVAKWKADIHNKNLLLPLLLVNGRLRISGPFDIRQLMDTIEFETEMRV